MDPNVANAAGIVLYCGGNITSNNNVITLTILSQRGLTFNGGNDTGNYAAIALYINENSFFENINL